MVCTPKAVAVEARAEAEARAEVEPREAEALEAGPQGVEQLEVQRLTPEARERRQGLRQILLVSAPQ